MRRPSHVEWEVPLWRIQGSSLSSQAKAGPPRVGVWIGLLPTLSFTPS